MGLHSATAGVDHNKYDGAREDLDIQQVIFEAIYKGSAVNLVKGICVLSYGGEILATKAMYEALLNSKQGADDISIQKMGHFHIEHVRSVELMQCMPHNIPHRTFPPHKQRHKSTFVDVESPSLSHYDPFPSTEDPEHGDNDHADNEDEEYDTTKEHDSADSDRPHDAHSSEDEQQHNPKISQPRRRPSITQFTTGVLH